MTRDDIIRMAREVYGPHEFSDEAIFLLEKFANLVAIKVAASEREWMQETNVRLIAEAVSAEREACIKVIEAYQIPVGNSPAGELACDWTYDALKQIRDEIRERGVK